MSHNVSNFKHAKIPAVMLIPMILNQLTVWFCKLIIDLFTVVQSMHCLLGMTYLRCTRYIKCLVHPRYNTVNIPTTSTISSLAMSSGYSPQEAAIIDMKEITAQDYSLTAASVLVLLEHIATFPQEFQIYWRRKLTGVTYIFLINRYLLLLFAFITLSSLNPWPTPLSCEVIGAIFHVSLLVLIQIMIAVFSTLRAYAISGCKLGPSVFVLLFGLVPAATNLFNVAKQSFASVYNLSSNGSVCLWASYISGETTVIC